MISKKMFQRSMSVSVDLENLLVLIFNYFFRVILAINFANQEGINNYNITLSLFKELDGIFYTQVLTKKYAYLLISNI